MTLSGGGGGGGELPTLTDEDVPLCADCNHTRTLHEDNTGGGDGACGADDCFCDGYASAEDVATGPLCMGCNHSGSEHLQGICIAYQCDCKSLVLGMVGNATLGLKNRRQPDERPELQRQREIFELGEARKPTVSGRAAAILWAKGKPK